jgi:uncharacterized protein (DUF1697 family)
MATSYIAFLRGINVGGRMAKMDQLRAIFSDLGVSNVRSYIQSGNVFFDSDDPDRGALRAAIEDRLTAELGYGVCTFLRTIPEVRLTLERAPFRDLVTSPATRLFVAFLSNPLPDTIDFPYFSPRRDMEVVSTCMTEAYLIVRQEAGRPGNPGAFIEKTFAIQATLRFHHTLEKIVLAAGES